MQSEWDACLLTLEGHNSRVDNLAFSPDSRIMASSDWKGTIKIWDPYTGACLNTISGHDSTVFGLTFLSKEPSTILASAGKGSDGYSIKIWDAFNGGPPRRTFAMPNKMSNVVAFIAGSKTAVWANEAGTLIKLDLDTGALLGTIELPAKPIAVSPDGQTIITCEEDEECCRVWDWCNPETDRLTLDCHPDDDHAVISPDSTKLVFVCETEHLNIEVEVWDLTTRVCSSSFRNADYPAAASLAFSPDGTAVAFADGDGMVNLWDTTTDMPQALSGHSDTVWALAISPDGKLLASGCQDKTIKIWDPTIRAPLNFHAGPNEGPQDWLLSPDGLWVASRVRSDCIRMWSSVTSEYVFDLYDSTLESLHPSIGLTDILEISPCGRWLAFWFDDGIKIWDTTIWKIQVEHELPEWYGWGLGNMALQSDEAIEIWDLHTGKLKSKLSSSLCGCLIHMPFSPNGLWLALDSLEGFEIWDWAAKECIQVPNENLYEVSWHPAHDALLRTSCGNFCVQGSTGNCSIEKVQLLDEEVEEDEGQVQMTEDSEWVTVQGKRVLWVPSQYRPRFKFIEDYGPSVEKAVDCNKSGIAMLDNCNRVIYIDFDLPEIVLKF